MERNLQDKGKAEDNKEKRLTQEEIDKIKEMARDKRRKYSKKEIAEKIGVPTFRISIILRQEGIITWKEELENKKREKILRLAKDNKKDLSIQEIAKRVKTPVKKVQKVLREEGIEGRDEEQEEKRRKVLEMADDDRIKYSAQEIADEVKATIAWVKRVVREEGRTLESSERSNAYRRISKIMEMAANKCELRKISSEVGVSIGRIELILEEEGIDYYKGIETSDTIEEVTEMSQGAEQQMSSTDSIPDKETDVLSTNSTHKRGRKISKTTLKIIELRQSGKSISDIKDEVGKSYAAVYKILRKYKIKPLQKEEENTSGVIQGTEQQISSTDSIPSIKENVSSTDSNSNKEADLPMTNTADKLTLQQKVKSIKLYLAENSLETIATELQCEKQDIEEYLESIKLNDVTMKMLKNSRLTSKIICERTGIPINLIEDWRMVIAKEKQRQRAEYRRKYRTDSARKNDVKRSSFLASINARQQIDPQREQELDYLANELNRELSDEDIFLIKGRTSELKVIPRVLVERAIRKENFSIEQAMIITENAIKLGVSKTAAMQSVISKYIQQKDFDKAQEFLHAYSSELKLEERNQMIKDIREAMQREEYNK